MANREGLRRGEGWIKARERADGSTAYQAGWLDGDRQRTRTFPSEEQAEDFLRELGRARRAGRYVAPVDLTVAEAVAQHLARRADDVAPTTMGSYRDAARRWIVPQLGRLRVEQLTAGRIQAWIDDLSRAGYAPRTVEIPVVVLKQTLVGLVRLGVLARNPADGVRLPTIKRADKRAWTAEEARAALAAAAGDPFWLAALAVALGTGARPGELRALAWDDVDLERGVARIRRTITEDGHGREIMGATTKGKRERAAALPDGAVAALRAWKVEQKRRRLAAREWEEAGWIFTGPAGRWISETAFTEGLARLCAQAGVTRMTPHGLRHTNATTGLEAGEHPAVVKERLGHANIATTYNTYVHVSIELQQKSAAAFDRLFFGPDESDDDRSVK